MTRRMPGAALALMLATGLLAARSAGAFNTWRIKGPAVHETITRWALGEHRFTERAIMEIDAGNRAQDIVGTANFADATHHFDGNQIDASLAFVERTRQELVALAPQIVPADSAPAQVMAADTARTRCRYLFGALLHSIQDFYSHSNYLELNLARGVAPDELRLIDWNNRPAGLHTGYFTESEALSRARAARTIAADHPNVRLHTDQEWEARVASTDPAVAFAYVNSATALLHTEINKDTALEAQGSLRWTAGGITQSFHSLAARLAERETGRQWELIEAAIQASHGEQATKIIDRLKGIDNLGRSILFLVDTSGSMSGTRIREAERAVVRMVEVAASGSEEQEWAILTFSNHDVEEVLPFTTNVGQVRAWVADLRASGDTPLKYATAKATTYLLENGNANQGQLVILCDGDDNCPGPTHASSSIRDPIGDAAAADKLRTIFQDISIRPAP